MKAIKKIIKSFSLVELLIVVVIIMVLGAVAVMSLMKWLTKSNNSIRITNLNTLNKAISIYYYEYDKYIKPSNAIKILDQNGDVIGYQGIIDDRVISQGLNISKIPKDPSTKDYFLYTVYSSDKGYEIGGFLDDFDKDVIFDRAYANSRYLPFIIYNGQLNMCLSTNTSPNPLSLYDKENRQFLSQHNLGEWGNVILDLNKVQNVDLNQLNITLPYIKDSLKCNRVAPVKCVNGTLPANRVVSTIPGLDNIILDNSICQTVSQNVCTHNGLCNMPDIYVFHDNYIYLVYKLGNGDYMLDVLDKGTYKSIFQYNLGPLITSIPKLQFIYENNLEVVYQKSDGKTYNQIIEKKADGTFVPKQTEQQLDYISPIVQTITKQSVQQTSTVSVEDKAYAGNGVYSIYSSSGGGAYIQKDGDVSTRVELIPSSYTCRLPQTIDVYRNVYMITYEDGGLTKTRTVKVNSDNSVTEISTITLSNSQGSNHQYLPLRDGIYGILYKDSNGKGYLKTVNLSSDYEILGIFDEYAFDLTANQIPTIYDIGGYNFVIAKSGLENSEFMAVYVSSMGEIVPIEGFEQAVNCPVKRIQKESENSYYYVCEKDGIINVGSLSIVKKENLTDSNLAFVKEASGNIINGECGSINGTIMVVQPSLSSGCNQGSFNNLQSYNTGWTWNCVGSSLGTTANCSTNFGYVSDYLNGVYVYYDMDMNPHYPDSCNSIATQDKYKQTIYDNYDATKPNKVKNGYYLIKYGSSSVKVYCDMESNAGVGRTYGATHSSQISSKYYNIVLWDTHCAGSRKMNACENIAPQIKPHLIYGAHGVNCRTIYRSSSHMSCLNSQIQAGNRKAWYVNDCGSKYGLCFGAGDPCVGTYKKHEFRYRCK